MDGNKISIPLSNGKHLVAEINDDPDFKEIFIGIEDADGYWDQSLAIVRERYKYGNNFEYIPMPNKYDVLIYSDCNYDDYKSVFQIDART